jgi:hypothetical protein
VEVNKVVGIVNCDGKTHDHTNGAILHHNTAHLNGSYPIFYFSNTGCRISKFGWGGNYYAK